MAKSAQHKAPRHVRAATRRWFDAVLEIFELEAHHVRLLTLACEAWDRGQAAREAIEQHGLTYVDRFDQPRARPEVNIERDARIGFARLVRELGLDVDEPNTSGSPIIRGRSNRVEG